MQKNTKLKIPFGHKDWAKAIAKAAGVALFWDAENKWWICGGNVPEELESFIVNEPDAKNGAPKSKSRKEIAVLDIPFQLRSLAQAFGAKWDATKKAFVCERPLPRALTPFEPKQYTFEWRAENLANGRTAAPCNPEKPAPLRAWQKTAQLEIVNAVRKGAPGFLLADQTGLGKTYSAWAGATSSKKFKSALICCPASVCSHWRRTVLSMGDFGMDVLIINYERLHKLFEIPQGKGKTKKGVARFGTSETFDLVIWDEAHRLKNPAAARSKLAAKIRSKAKFSIWLSATAGQTPLELSYLAPILAWKTGNKVSDLNEFEKWAQGMGIGLKRGSFGKWDWEENKDDLARVNNWLFHGDVHVGMRRRSEEIEGLSAMERQTFVAELSEEGKAQYLAGWNSFRTAAKTIKKTKVEDRKKGSALAMVQMQRMRMLLSEINIPTTVERTVDYLDEGSNVAISCAFLATQATIRDLLEKQGIPCSIINGSLSQEEKENERLRFQNEETRVAIFTIEEGISLHQGEMPKGKTPRILFIHDLRWSAIQMSQIEGRCHRDGSFAPTVWRVAEGTMEERIFDVVSKRMLSMGTMMGDPDKGLNEMIEAVLFEMAEED